MVLTLLEDLNAWLNSNQWFGVYILPVLIWRCIWAYATRAVIKGKGYKADWFLWGFFFGLIAFIVAICKPNFVNTPEFIMQLNKASTDDGLAARREEQGNATMSDAERLREYKKLLDEGIITQEEFERKKAKIMDMD